MTGVQQMPQSRAGKIVPLEAHGLRLMSLGFLMPDGAPTVWRGPMVAGAIQQFLRDVTGGAGLPGHRFASRHRDRAAHAGAVAALHGVIRRLTPQDVATQIASKALGMFQQLKVPILGILENMSGCVPALRHHAPIFQGGGGRRASQQLGVPLLARFPLDPLVCQASDRGEPIVTAHPNSPMAEAFRHAAEAIWHSQGGGRVGR